MFEQTTREQVYICLSLRDKLLEFESTTARDTYSFIRTEELKSWEKALLTSAYNSVYQAVASSFPSFQVIQKLIEV